MLPGRPFECLRAQRGRGGDSVGPGQHKGGHDKRQMNHDLPENFAVAQAIALNKGLKQMDRRDTDERRRQLHFQDPGVDMRDDLRDSGARQRSHNRPRSP